MEVAVGVSTSASARGATRGRKRRRRIVEGIEAGAGRVGVVRRIVSGTVEGVRYGFEGLVVC